MEMKALRFLFVIGLLAACQSAAPEAESVFTGNGVTYDLQSGSPHGVTGTIVFKERRDGKVTASVQLLGTAGAQLHPVHLHLGNLSTPDADVALLLNPVNAADGKSVTTFSMLADVSQFTYEKLSDLEASIKIHLGDVGDDRNVILAAGNIGLSFMKANPGGRTGIATCKSE